MISELRGRASELSEPASTLYLGGGTPSLWDTEQLEELLNAVSQAPGLGPDAEITLEANPSEVTPAQMARLRALGVNRISLGVQSFQDDLLLGIERRHNGDRARDACRTIANAGFRSHSVDLIFGLPNQTLARWHDDLDAILALKPPHLSVYGLTVEPRTVMQRQVETGAIEVPDDALQAEMMFAARDRLRSSGYIHYEVSSYALPGHRARHNSSYWRGVPYLGLGPGAHGFLPPRRWINIRRPSQYIRAAMSGDPTESVEELDEATLSFERIMTGLRDLERGVDFGEDWERFAAAAQRQALKGNLALDGRHARLTDRGLRLMNSVLLDLL